ncbi:hypothetical protein C8F01DRAFT_1346179 [Mycena amicta]|nr:hypothetical protein C8F01DRAFT_1346179 [Mycena amicta]
MDPIRQSLKMLQDTSAEFSARTKVADLVRLRALKKQEDSETLVELRERVWLTDMLLGLLERRTALRQELVGIEESCSNFANPATKTCLSNRGLFILVLVTSAVDSLHRFCSNQATTSFFADVDKSLVDTINRDKAYDVHILDSTEEGDIVEEVNRVKGVLATTDDIIAELAHPKLKLVTTAVGLPVLWKIASTIAKGLKARREAGVGTKHRRTHLDNVADKEYVSMRVGFANCSVDRIIPPFRPKSFDDSSLDVGVENFFEWVVDSAALKPDDEQSVEMRKALQDKGLEVYVAELTGFEKDGEPCKTVLDAYKELDGWVKTRNC